VTSAVSRDDPAAKLGDGEAACAGGKFQAMIARLIVSQGRVREGLGLNEVGWSAAGERIYRNERDEERGDCHYEGLHPMRVGIDHG